MPGLVHDGEIQPGPDSDGAGEVQGLEDDSLASKPGRSCSGGEETSAAGASPERGPRSERESRPERRSSVRVKPENVLRRDRAFAIEADAGVQPVDGVDHVAHAVGDAPVWRSLAICLLEDAIEIDAYQSIAGVAFVEVAAYAHVLVGEREERFRNPAVTRVEALFDDQPRDRL